MSRNHHGDAEARRLEEDARPDKNWKRWGPYLAERQWVTVREDYSPDGNCWGYFPHEHARSRANRWGEDGLLDITDRECRLCFALALWNERDPIFKEPLFGMTNPEGNHSADVKECYWWPKPQLEQVGEGTIAAEHATLGRFRLGVAPDQDGMPPPLLFTENETNFARLYGSADGSLCAKDAYHEYVVHANRGAVNPARRGTKTAAHYLLEVPLQSQLTARQ
jgi:hypothetical protein